MSRIPLIEREHLDDEGLRLYDEILAARGSIAGPFRIWLHSPEFTSHATRLGKFLRYRTSLPRRLSELVILLAAQATDCPGIRGIHAPLAREAGIPGETIAAIETGEAPAQLSAEDAAVLPAASPEPHCGCRSCPAGGGVARGECRCRNHRTLRLLHHGRDDAKRF